MFIEGTYYLEGDTSLIFFAYDRLSDIKDRCEICLTGELPNVQALILNRDPSRLDYWKSFAYDCIEPGFQYFFRRVFGEEYKRTIALLKIARMFNPAFVKSRRLSAADIPKLVDELKSVVWCEEWKREALLANFSNYIRILADSSEDFSYLNSENLLNWWYSQSELKELYEVVAYLAAMQVSSAAVERVFSLLALGFEKGDAHLADYVESSLMLAYNSNMRKK
jgi:hypothetical protein